MRASSWAVLLAAGLTPAVACAAGRLPFDVPAQPLTQALVEFAVQANVSISVDQAVQCRRTANAVVGAYGVEQGLTRLLAGTGCGFTRLDASTYRVRRVAPAPTPAPRPAARPVGPPVAAPPKALPPLEPANISELVVTATRRKALVERLPDAVSSVSGAEIANGRAADVADLAGQVGGVTVTNLGPGRDKILVRGLSDGPLTGHTQSTVGIYLDDVRVTYNAPDPDLRLADIDRVEIVRGPQGTLWGAGSVGGVVHIVTKAPELDRFSGYVQGSAASTEGGDASGSAEAMVNLPVIAGRLAVRGVGWYERDGGYIDDIRLGLHNVNTTTRFGERVALRLKLSDDWSLSAGVTHQGIDNADSQYAAAGLPRMTRALRLREPHDNDFTQAYVSIEGETALGRVKNAFSVIRHDLTSVYDASTDLPRFPPFLSVRPAPFDDGNRIELTVDELTLTSAGAGRVQWIAGAFFSGGEQNLTSQLGTTLAGAPVVVLREGRVDSLRELAGFGEITVAITPRLTATLGARAYQTRLHTVATTLAPLIGGQDGFTGDLTDASIAPKAALRYQLATDTMVYALASQGYRAGGFNTGGLVGTVYGQGPGDPQPFRRYTRDDLWNFEAGFKTRLFDRRLTLRAAGFYDLWYNIQSDRLTFQGLAFTANLGDGRNYGVEVETAWRSGGLTVRANAMFDRPELIRLNPGFPTTRDSGLPGVPKISAGADVRYERAIASGLTASVEADFAYVGASILTFDSRTAPAMGDYSNAKVAIGLAGHGWRASAFVDNLGGVAGNTFAYGNPFTLRRGLQITPQRPRTVGVVVARSF
ncbi:MAG TPA: TonB-dependent receptor [Caulobacteraceae bacterium]|nr:TonB-dependent receptor [Caulobacteraceae bacterium]